MKVWFDRTGGFAAIPLTVFIDSESLREEEAGQLKELVNASDFTHLASEKAEPPRTPDRFLYTITLEMDGGKHTVRTGEGEVPAQLKPLINWLTRMARKHRGGKK